MRNVWVCLLVVSLLGCGDRDRRSPSSRDGSVPSDGGSTIVDAGPGQDARVPTPDAARGDSGFPVGCGEDAVDPGTRLPRSCYNDATCYDHPLCVAAMLEADGRAGYAECGDPVGFSPADADAICAAGPPFGDWPIPFTCGQAAFEGTARFFCSPDGSTVLVRFSGTVRATSMTDYLTYYGHDYELGSSGGSGYAYSVSTPLDDLTGDAFVGFEPVPRTADGAGGFYPFSLTVYFITGDIADKSYFIGGGFSVTYPPA
jgi:hypothetical protein